MPYHRRTLVFRTGGHITLDTLNDVYKGLTNRHTKGDEIQGRINVYPLSTAETTASALHDVQVLPKATELGNAHYQRRKLEGEQNIVLTSLDRKINLQCVGQEAKDAFMAPLKGAEEDFSDIKIYIAGHGGGDPSGRISSLEVYPDNITAISNNFSMSVDEYAEIIHAALYNMRAINRPNTLIKISFVVCEAAQYTESQLAQALAEKGIYNVMIKSNHGAVSAPLPFRWLTNAIKIRPKESIYHRYLCQSNQENGKASSFIVEKRYDYSYQLQKLLKDCLNRTSVSSKKERITQALIKLNAQKPISDLADLKELQQFVKALIDDKDIKRCSPYTAWWMQLTGQISRTQYLLTQFQSKLLDVIANAQQNQLECLGRFEELKPKPVMTQSKGEPAALLLSQLKSIIQSFRNFSDPRELNLPADIFGNLFSGEDTDEKLDSVVKQLNAHQLAERCRSLTPTKNRQYYGEYGFFKKYLMPWKKTPAYIRRHPLDDFLAQYEQYKQERVEEQQHRSQSTPV